MRFKAFSKFCVGLADLIAADPKRAEATARRMGEAFADLQPADGWQERLDQAATERGF